MKIQAIRNESPHTIFVPNQYNEGTEIEVNPLDWIHYQDLQEKIRQLEDIFTIALQKKEKEEGIYLR